MKIHIVTVGKPKLMYARYGWVEYLSRLQRLHQVRLTQLADRHAYDEQRLREALAGSFSIAMEITGTALSSQELAAFLKKRELAAQEISIIIGGPEGLPRPIRDSADFCWSLSALTLPHDLAMVVTLEALYRASTINAGLPYHK